MTPRRETQEVPRAEPGTEGSGEPESLRVPSGKMDFVRVATGDLTVREGRKERRTEPHDPAVLFRGV